MLWYVYNRLLSLNGLALRRRSTTRWYYDTACGFKKQPIVFVLGDCDPRVNWTYISCFR